MKLISMTATFGKLERSRLAFGEGLNVIYAPNEGGKSTWSAFWKTMLYGLDTRDRDKKGHLADKNRYQPWSGLPMEGELVVEHQGRSITIRRGPKGAIPFGAFSAVYTGTEEAVPGLTGDTCGLFLTGVGREVFERSAFIGPGGTLTITGAPELERRIAALVSSGQEDVSFSQAERQLREWLNRRKVNRSVGQIPKLEEELTQVRDALAQLSALNSDIAQLEGAKAALTDQQADLRGEEAIHRRLAQKELNRRYAIAGEELNQALTQLEHLEQEVGKYGPLPDKDKLKQAQGELQYLKVLDEEIKQGEAALAQAEESYVQAQIDAQDEHFAGMSGEEAVRHGEQVASTFRQTQEKAAKQKKRSRLTLALSLLTSIAAAGIWYIFKAQSWAMPAIYGLTALTAALLMVSLWLHLDSKKAAQSTGRILARYQVHSPEELTALAQDYQARCRRAEEAAQQSKTLRGALNDRKARRDNSHADLMAFVRSFAPQATGLFGCSAALSRALNLDHELALARERVEERRRRREDLGAQGGQDFDTLELLHTPEHTLEETQQALATVAARLEQVNQALNQALGQQKAMGDSAALAAREEELSSSLSRRQQEYEALTIAMDALHQANAQLQERFSPALNRLAGQYLARLTGARYTSVSLSRELDGSAARAGDVLPHNSLYLSRGTVDQLYLAVRLAVCQLCLPEKPPILLDDALAAFDDERLHRGLSLLRELATKQQILLFSCHKREYKGLEGASDVTHLTL